MILRSYLDLLRAQVHHRIIGAVMAEAELIGPAAEREAENLMAETDAANRLAAEHAAHRLARVWQSRRIGGAVGEENAVGIGRKDVVGGRRSRHYAHAKAAG